jgi:hypothetical protein
MRTFLFTVLLLSGTGISAQVYRCPQAYPGKDKPAAPLTGAIVRQTESTPTNNLLDEEAAEEGYDSHFALDPADQTWLVCFYGGNERIKGRFHDGHEWNQRIVSADSVWETRLVPKLSDCTIQTREAKTADPSKSVWSVTATCK